MTLGADMCVDSAHKTLPALTGGAYLHLNCAVNEVIGGLIDRETALFYSTSPSWLTLYSLDSLNDYLTRGYKEKLAEFVVKVDKMKKALVDFGFALVGDEKLKITVKTKSFGYTGDELAAVLRRGGVEPEYSDPDYVTMMLTPEIADEELKKAEKVLLSIEKKEAIKIAPPAITLPKRACSIREATFALTEEIAVNDAIGRLFASSALVCPPAVPIVVAGETIDASGVAALNYYGVKTCRVVK